MGRELLCCWGYNPRGGQAASVHCSFSLYLASGQVPMYHHLTPCAWQDGSFPTRAPQLVLWQHQGLQGGQRGAWACIFLGTLVGIRRMVRPGNLGERPSSVLEVQVWSCLQCHRHLLGFWVLIPWASIWDETRLSQHSVLLMEWISKLKAELVSG